MDFDVLDALEALSYPVDEIKLKEALKLGPKSIYFTSLIAWLSKELQSVCELEAVINPITDSEDSSTFLLEVSSFLKELYCPYDCLMDGPISQRLGSSKARLLLLNFLCYELQAARILHRRNRSKKNALGIQMVASENAVLLSDVLNSMKIDFSLNGGRNILECISSELEDHPIKFSPIFKEQLTADQWILLEKLQKDLHSEYKARKEMMLRRLDVTLASFKWGAGAQVKEQLASRSLSIRSSLKSEPNVNITDVLIADEGLLHYQKMSDTGVVKNTSVHKVIIGHVPDRGGRPKEQRPPVEMPGFSKRFDGGGGGGRGGFGRGGFQRGGRGKHGRGDRGRRY